MKNIEKFIKENIASLSKDQIEQIEEMLMFFNEHLNGENTQNKQLVEGTILNSSFNSFDDIERVYGILHDKIGEAEPTGEKIEVQIEADGDVVKIEEPEEQIESSTTEAKDETIETESKEQVEEVKKEENSNRLNLFNTLGVDETSISTDKSLKELKGLYKRDGKLIGGGLSDVLSGEQRKVEEDFEEKQKEAIEKGSNKESTLVLKGVRKLLDNLIDEAIERRASDIHFEPKQYFEEDGNGSGKNKVYIRVRFRINGDLLDQEQFSFYDDEVPFLSIRNMIYARSEINGDKASNVPLDGKFSFFYSNLEKGVILKKMEIRVASLPEVIAQGLVLRILGGFSVPDIDKVGLSNGKNSILFDTFMLGLKQKEGITLVTGPTGSGKSTTLNSTLKHISQDTTVKVVTGEDPIEYEIIGAVQSKIESQVFGTKLESDIYSYAKFIKSALRFDPDVILIGELRDNETIEAAIRAALTGHAVFSTIHTQSTALTITRLRSEGANVEALASALNMIVAQRLIKTPCPHCSTKVKLSEEQKSHIKKIFEPLKDSTIESLGISKELENLDDLGIVKAGKGCDHENCLNGYNGRTPIFEIMLVNKKLRELIIDPNSNAIQIEDVAVKENGMPLLIHNGLVKMFDGQITYEDLDSLFNFNLITM